MSSNEKAYVFLSEGIVTPLNPRRLQRFHVSLQEEACLRYLNVRVENRGELTVSFCGSKERDEDNMLCEMDVTLPPSTNDPDKTPVEFLDLPFDDDTLHEAPFEGSNGILTACNGVLHDIGRRDIYDDHLRCIFPFEREALKSFLRELSKLDPEHKQRWFDEIVSTLEKGGEGRKHIKDRLIEAENKINAQISDWVCDVVADRVQGGISWKTLAGDLRSEITDDEINALKVGKECCRAVLLKWSQEYTRSATSKELIRCLTNRGLANGNWQIMKELGLVQPENIPSSER